MAFLTIAAVDYDVQTQGAGRGFKIEFLRFASQLATKVNAPAPTQAVTNINVDSITIDAKSLTPGQLFDLIRSEAQRRALAQFGTTTRAAEALS